ncbi:ABC-2 type transport system permease protein [Nocardioides aurantiacus]|uniref:ABC-2 type transport system permease protein n=1 Tax=Nocardioides aurantiacus TaxID=86796 RepID=A0A3N2CTJ6_9ACTN|nr:ABC-2 type transport system permease protein [Nocardioides aurantiacus]
MLRNVFTKALRDQRWALLGWGTGLVLLVLAESSVWPTIRDMPDLDRLLEGYPRALEELFDLSAMTTATGFMNAELFTLVLPMLFIIFGVTRGARMVAGEEEAGTLGPLLVTRLSPRSLLLQKAAALVVAVVALGLVLLSSTWASSTFFDLGLSVPDIASGTLAVVLLGTEFGLLALAVGAASGRRALALGVAGSLALASYLLYALGLLVDALEPWRMISPFAQALSQGPLGAGVPPSFAWLLLGAAVVVAASLPVFTRRDVRGA